MWAGMAAGAVLAVAGGFAVGGALDNAGAQSGFAVTPGQLQTNQKISQAAVRRSNRSLNYLAPIRTQASDAADNGSKGVKTLSTIPGAGQGWTSGQIANGAITGPKVADGAIAEAKLAGAVQARLQTVYRAAVFNTPGQEPALEPQSEGVTALARTPALPAGGFDITFGESIEGCTWTGSVSTVRGSALTPVFAPFVVWPTRLGANQLRVFTLNATTGTPADAPFVVTVDCG
jgi:hypothetical protein